MSSRSGKEKNVDKSQCIFWGEKGTNEKGYHLVGRKGKVKVEVVLTVWR